MTPSAPAPVPFPAFTCAAPLAVLDGASARLPWVESAPRSADPRGGIHVLGRADRLDPPASASIITMVGSRRTSSRYLTAAVSLARALSDEVGPVAGGMAAGADSAALSGAVRGRWGAIVIPACGLGRVPGRALALAESGAATFAGLFPFYASFNSGYAIARNHVLAAMGRALVLVASDLKGGSTYAVNHALAHNIPVFCFESGASTPAANAHLIRTGRATPLSLRSQPSDWVNAIITSLSDAMKSAKRKTPRQLSCLAV